MRSPSLLPVASLLLSLFLQACAGPAGPGTRVSLTNPSAANPLSIDPSSHDFQANPGLLDRLARDPHTYFRFLNQPFTRLVCDEFKGDLHRLPDVNLHGDAHLEQYAVTSQSRGLADFDAATYGPAVVDLVRFCTSLRLACRENGWFDAEHEVCATFLQSYIHAVTQPDLLVPEPQVVARIRAGWPKDRAVLVTLTESLMQPLQIPLGDLLQPLGDYCLRVLAHTEELDQDFFAVKTAGKLKIGIGSGLQTKYLLRIEGPSDVPGDDIFIEAREIHAPEGIDCLDSGRPNDPQRILTVASRLCRQPDLLAGYCFLPTNGQSPQTSCFRIRTWELQYGEIEVIGSLTAVGDLSELATDVGAQLGRGHPLGIGASSEDLLRGELVAVTSELRGRILHFSRELADQTQGAWELFCTGDLPAARPSDAAPDEG